jgi:hypothetical protein
MISTVATAILRCELPIVALRARTLQLTRTAATFTEVGIAPLHTLCLMDEAAAALSSAWVCQYNDMLVSV